MVQFRRFPTYNYLIHHTLPCGGFPHSEISGSQLICSSPKLIAAYHVLHRLLMPRHSPCALSRLTFFGPITCSRYCRIMQAPRRQMLRSFASAVPLSRSVQSSFTPLCLLSDSNPLALGFESGWIFYVQQNCNLPKLLVFLKRTTL